MTTSQRSIPFRLPRSFLRGRRANRVLPDDTLEAAGHKVLRRLFMEMARHQPGLSQGDHPASVHDMRVAVRRMRAAFELFEQAFPRKSVKVYGRFLKDLGSLLGSVRDAEVILGNAQAYLETLPEGQRAGFQPLPDFFRARRDAGLQPLLGFLAESRTLAFVTEFPVFLSETKSKSPQAGKPSRVSDVAPLLILERLSEVRSFDGHIERLSTGQLHALRGDIKRLRYALEFFQEPLGPQSALLIADLKNVQTHLGQLNDAGLAAQAIQGFIDDWNARQAQLPAAAKSSSVPFLPYLTQILARLDGLVQTFPQAWAQFNTVDFRRRLGRAIARL